MCSRSFAPVRKTIRRFKAVSLGRKAGLGRATQERAPVSTEIRNGDRDSLIAALRDAAVRREDTRPYGTDKKLREDAASKGNAMTKIPRSLRASAFASPRFGFQDRRVPAIARSISAFAGAIRRGVYPCPWPPEYRQTPHLPSHALHASSAGTAG
jgi:hypothetical protein